MKKLFFMGAMSLITSAYAQTMESEKDSTELKTIKLDEVLVSAVRAKQTLPVTFSNLSKSDIAKRNQGQQIPMLLGSLPNVVSYSEDGTGFGATYLSVRGSDLYRTNVTINGIPYNDSESQGTFWYNLSDFASSAENIQLQRGVGTSTNGAGAFGASLNVLTDAVSENPYAEIANFYGSYNTHKHMVKLSTGKINERFELSGRFSKINSNGYRDRASSDLKSYFLQGAYSYKNTLIKALVFGGKEKTQLTWIGIDEATLNKDRKYNPAGKYKDAEGNTRFYDNETDNYQQDHAQLHWVEKWSPFWTTNLAFHYTKGRGHWEMYETWGGATKHQITRYALDNDFYGATLSSNFKKNTIDLIFGGAFNKYDGLHFEERVWSEEASKPYQEIVDENWGYKKDGSAFAKMTWKFAPQWDLFADIQYRYVHYKSDEYKADKAFNFINPKIGVSFSLNENNYFYLSYAKATKEPNRSDYKAAHKEYKKAKKTDPSATIREPRPEKLNDFELGWRYNTPKVKINTNLYYMLYKDQLVLTGRLNDKGYPIRDNSGDSYRAGLEVDATLLLSDKWIWQPNVSVSRNKNIDFHTIKEGKSVNIGNTKLSYSPEFVASSSLTFKPIPNFSATLSTKYVGEQYMSNINEENSKLKSYFVNNLHLSYEINPLKFCKSIVISVTGNNILNAKYVANGTFEDGQAAYFPQAEINYLAGLTLSF
ncbi:TonB-dependent receptor [Capnocytophaga cynodegmi]|uniref:TonB-dependent receptor n=1 Tax=Capnocytophaga cynodegmi TaxID=28189 RepID=UPI001ACFC169|nr:TonB-dependent receptor [Capnocytophaga cynodegmi]GIM52842.1 TonB-dependent receptor [Capnocytophaga cynodegmi]